jgi:hypothetical protein
MYSTTSAAAVTANIKQGMVALYQRGARHCFVPMMPDLSITPSAQQHNKTDKTYLVSAKQRRAGVRRPRPPPVLGHEPPDCSRIAAHRDGVCTGRGWRSPAIQVSLEWARKELTQASGNRG